MLCRRHWLKLLRASSINDSAGFVLLQCGNGTHIPSRSSLSDRAAVRRFEYSFRFVLWFYKYRCDSLKKPVEAAGKAG